ncbi:MAG: hypothetical protein ACFFDC_21255, partial [Promethearchaeota archaeon]
YNDIFYVSHKDLELLKPGKIIRLKDLTNLRINQIKTTENQISVISDYDKDTSLNFTKIQWVPKNYSVELVVNVPGPLYIEEEINPHSLRVEQGYIEKSVLELHEGDLIQLERIGFGKIVKLDQKSVEINLTESL